LIGDRPQVFRPLPGPEHHRRHHRHPLPSPRRMSPGGPPVRGCFATLPGQGGKTQQCCYSTNKQSQPEFASHGRILCTFPSRLSAMDSTALSQRSDRPGVVLGTHCCSRHTSALGCSATWPLARPSPNVPLPCFCRNLGLYFDFARNGSHDRVGASPLFCVCRSGFKVCLTNPDMTNALGVGPA